MTITCDSCGYTADSRLNAEFEQTKADHGDRTYQLHWDCPECDAANQHEVHVHQVEH